MDVLFIFTFYITDTLDSSDAVCLMRCTHIVVFLWSLSLLEGKRSPCLSFPSKSLMQWEAYRNYQRRYSSNCHLKCTQCCEYFVIVPPMYTLL